MPHRSVPQAHHHYSVRTGPNGQPTLVDFTPKHEPHEMGPGGRPGPRLQQHIPPHHMPHAGVAASRIPPALSVNLKRPPPEDDEHGGPMDGPTGSAKRGAEDPSVAIGQRPPLTRGESLPAVPFVPDQRQPSYKDKHPVRTASFDAAASFKPAVALYGRRRVSLIGAFFALHDRNTKKSASLGWRTRKKKKKHQRKRRTSESLQRRVRLRRILPSCARDIARFKDEEAEDGEDLGADEVRVKEIERNVPRPS
ncbi:hypothetical protein quinque_001364 [Culex quinquefasciatus]